MELQDDQLRTAQREAIAAALDSELSAYGRTVQSYASPAEAVQALIALSVQVALDPAVSDGAMALLERGKTEALAQHQLAEDARTEDFAALCKVHGIAGTAEAALCEVFYRRGADLAAKPAAPRELTYEDADEIPCPQCAGTGTEIGMSDGSPDAYEVEHDCRHCAGNQTLGAAYRGLVQDLAAQRAAYLQLSGKLYFANLKPLASPSPEGADALDAAMKEKHP